MLPTFFFLFFFCFFFRHDECQSQTCPKFVYFRSLPSSVTERYRMFWSGKFCEFPEFLLFLNFIRCRLKRHHLTTFVSLRLPLDPQEPHCLFHICSSAPRHLWTDPWCVKFVAFLSKLRPGVKRQENKNRPNNLKHTNDPVSSCLFNPHTKRNVKMTICGFQES